MPKRPYTYYRPQDLAEAKQYLVQPNAVPLAGGTKLLTGDVNSAVVDLQDLNLNDVNWQDGYLYIGATTRLTDLANILSTSDEQNKPIALLQNGIKRSGPNTYRNAATIGGTIASRLPDSELLAALLVLDATLTFVDSATMSLSDYMATDEVPKNLITQVTIRWQNGNWASERVARTPADYPIVSVTLWRADAEVAKLAATGIAQRPLRLTASEQALQTNGIDAAIQASKTACTHPGDFRGGADYRMDMVAILLKRVLA